MLATERRRDALLTRAGDLARRAAGQPPFQGSRGPYTLAASPAQLDGRPATVVAVGVPARGARLTPRQQEVAEHLARRRSNREIAAALGVSPHTARRHTEAVLRVLGLTDRRAVADALGRAE
ncbi:response regulator transcription factor [Rubrivirga sp. IMCC45206]|uniref:response regulator transcription factor n=1 Tax=Rubrivirga sp. IMCC45206 TaxID=3391614 RepID=UPI00398FC199